jgi:hypothetical protein
VCAINLIGQDTPVTARLASDGLALLLDRPRESTRPGEKWIRFRTPSEQQTQRLLDTIQARRAGQVSSRQHDAARNG